MSEPDKTAIESIKHHYDSHRQHLKAIVEAIVEQFHLDEKQGHQIGMAVEKAYQVGRRTTTTDDWCDRW